jgi:carotenoid cleavage dioxygenase
MTDTPFHLPGNLAPVRDEVTAFQLPVEGALSPEIQGLSVRRGANPVRSVVQPSHDGIVEIEGDTARGADGRWRFARRAFSPIYLGPPDLSAAPLGGGGEKVAP